eukprot:GHVQ01023688.1.p2 GENE.GHVQ01023688.1~~GHVQ01023688.1.p2  ORF type:complete len:350 (+),score=37.25 GHVQ01023688.1:379-1428(+)
MDGSDSMPSEAATDTAEHGLSGAVIGSMVGSMILLFSIGLAGALIPVYLKRRNLTGVMNMANAFAGGAFLALGIFHILPEAVGDLAASGLVIRVKDEVYNSAYLFVFIGYIIVLFCENVLFDPATSGKLAPPQSEGFCEANSRGPQPISSSSAMSSTAPCRSLPDERDATSEVGIAGGEQENGETGLTVDGGVLELKPVSHDIESHREICEKDVLRISFSGRQAERKRQECLYMLSSGGAFLMLALAIHGLFEGIVVGTNVDILGVWMTTLVIFGHKWAESFALMVELLDSDMGQRSIMVLMTAFLLSTPVGIGIGMAVSSAGQGLSGAFNGLGAGTVLYVAAEVRRLQ